jgi:hypothetical protein
MVEAEFRMRVRLMQIWIRIKHINNVESDPGEIYFFFLKIPIECYSKGLSN